MKNARLSAFDMLYDIIYGGAYSNIVLEKWLKAVESKDKGFVSRLVYGVIERRLSLDYAINKFLNGKTKPKVKILLYIGAYQVLYMDKIPDAVAVYETVSLCDNIGLSYYKKLINAVLHRIIDYKTEFDVIDDLSIKYSCPQHLINMWTKMYGEDNVVDILESINNRPPVFAIPNSNYVDAEELYYELFSAGIDCEVFNDVVKINSSFDLSGLKAFNDGLFYIEDYSSYSCAKALEAEPDDVVLDLCSAPGGKAFTIAQSGATVYAYDIYEHRVELIKKSAQKLGLNNIITGINDALIYNANLPFADRIICDVPCS